MKTAFPRKFKSLREKNGSERRSKSSEPGQRVRPLSTEAFLSLFKPDSSKHAAKSEEEKESAKIDDVLAQLEDSNMHHIPREHVRFALSSQYAEGSVSKAVEVLKLQQQAFSGIILPYQPNVAMVGAENRCNVTCYLDSLLFAMFAKLEAFECMLKNDSKEQTQQQLAALLRLYVNMLRSGKMIHADLVSIVTEWRLFTCDIVADAVQIERIQNALAACGWKDAQLLEQQDTSEAFAFITETLQLPLLTLQVDLFHQGKHDDDDHKVVYERLLNLAVPPDPEGKGIKLEDCLEDYFNTRVDVSRDSLDEKPADALAEHHENILHLVSRAEDPEAADHLGPPPPRRRWTLAEPASESSSSEHRPANRHRSTSIIQRIVIDEEGKKGHVEEDPATLLQKVKRQGSTVVKAVTIPAWQFFKLIPWHSTSHSEPRSDVEVVRHLNQKPVVGICLKRYMMTESGQPKRHNTFIDIPDSLRLPHFMMVDDLKINESNELNTEYKLVLQSVVCHRGDSLHSGHYIAFARVNPKLLTDNRRHQADPPPDYEDAQWVKFDDLMVEQRVTFVDDIRQALKEEMPYLLFYQILPMVDITTTSTEDDNDNEPPSYDDSTLHVNGAQSPIPDSESRALSRRTSGYFDNTALTNSTVPSVRFSAELERPSRLSVDEEPYAAATHLKAGTSRRGSLAVSEPYGISPAVTPESRSPALTPSEETTAQRLSRAAAKFAKPNNRSRPGSQAGEGRISLTMSRIGGLMRSSKDPLRVSEDGAETIATIATTATDVSNAPITAVASEPLLSAMADEKEEKHHHHHYHRPHRSKGKNRTGDKTKEKDKAGVPERECVVM
ncbi:uncharacterized protein E0L32_001897 [Thyridium curvatum]|uniref:ubiquitinyl hydrolase 1 n=1 Tax=Thyridium curvatum TaxID=1093900 RepID=A0A507AH73_9PEZI|nr:uncharacterized protein E0L32_001897 [Thyridium curvatum]TPX08322.1 hypothetical protein E0L32_001897 [Thyridium curvatum]